jgi:hypothetical protein
MIHLNIFLQNYENNNKQLAKSCFCIATKLEGTTDIVPLVKTFPTLPVSNSKAVPNINQISKRSLNLKPIS